MTYCYFQKKVQKTNRKAYYFIESSGFRRYVNSFDVIKREGIPFILPNLPRELNDKIWHMKCQLECLHKRWDAFIMSLTANQHILFVRLKQALVGYLRPRFFIAFALDSFPHNSRIYKKAKRQLLNY